MNKRRFYPLLIILAIFAAGTTQVWGDDPQGSRFFAYVTDNSKKVIHILSLNRSTGQVTTIKDRTVKYRPDLLVATPDGRFLYSLNTSAKQITAYYINQHNGSLGTAKGCPYPTASGSVDLAIDSCQQFLCTVGRYNGVGYISVYRMNRTTGQLTWITSKPYHHGSDFTYATFLGCGTLYACNGRDNYIAGYDIDPTSGKLVPGKSPLSYIPTGGKGSNKILFYLLNLYFFVANSDSQDISVFNWFSSTAPTPAQGSPVNVGFKIKDILLTPSYQYLYVLCTSPISNTSSFIRMYSFDWVTGTLKLSSTNAPILTGVDSRNMCFSPDKKFLYVSNYGRSIAVFSVNKDDDTLRPVGDPVGPFDAGKIITVETKY